ncbi:T9SS type A sorting domain-containing protein [Runella limosa]|uniref:T9SS type A sorting domain-containing protein n=1 Tax=Runella limosa TaxID=370978 RepID=UPI0003FB1DCA|nr:T9SS type A sorting domain-containing protein [Runella limosa]
MKFSKAYLFYFVNFLLWLFLPLTIVAQIRITFPSSRIVFQRDNAGNGTIPITGQYAQSIDRVEARVVPMVGGQGEQTDWRTIQENPQGGFYSGSISVRGGWYELQIRGMANGNVVTTTELQRVGVGEVFVVAGQSNAQGFFNYGAPSPGDDRVNCVNYYNGTHQNNSLPAPSFVKMSDNSNISPRGLSSWCWGRLGDILTNRLNVPVLFYNAGWEGTASKNWSETVDGGTTSSIYINDTYPPGQPYANLRLALNYYASLTGVRAVLWHQGEADNILNTNANLYVSNLQTVINKSRQHFGKNVGWVVARVSHYKGKNSQEVINGQNQTVFNTSAAYFGPNTDEVQIPRPDGAHLQNGGLADAANVWANSLDNNFFNNCSPQTGTYPAFSVRCAGGNQLNINVQGPFVSVQWNNGATGSSVNFGPGTYQATVRDASGNTYFTPSITVPNDLQSAPVSIAVDGKVPLCQGSSIGLTSSSSIDNNWSTGATSQRIDVSSGGTYTVTTRNLYGCSSAASFTVSTVNSPPPAKPTINASGALTFCQGGSVSLTASGANEYRWSNGERGQTIAARTSGIYEVRVLDSQGCTSEPTSVVVVVNTPPAAPSISATGNTSFCEGGEVTLSSNYSAGNVWSNGEQGTSIKVTTSGTYNVRFRDNNGCDAISNSIKVTANPLPAKPVITAERPLTFCEGDSTVLTSTNSAQYNWNNGARNRRISILQAGTFTVAITDANGCSSPVSDPVTVKTNPLPAAPTISADRTPNICENEVITLTSSAQAGYIWSNGQNTRTVTVNLTGRYSARTVDANQCQSPSSNVIAVTVNRLPDKPTITALGATTFCVGGQVQLTTNYNAGISWSNFQTTQTVTAITGGDYRVRYRDGNNCEAISDPFKVTVHPLPTAPSVISERPTTFCLFDNTVLTITSAGSSFKWSTGDEGRSIKTYSAGSVTATVYDPTTGCTSPASNPIKITVNPLPDKPTISVTGSTTICADKSVTLTASQAAGYQWSNSATTQSINANVAGNYTVAAKNEFGCSSSASDPITVRVIQLPNPPSVIAEGRTTFCEGEQVGLRVESPYQVIWNTGETTSRIIAKQSGNYAASIRDDSGCQSPYTGAVRVEAKTLPATPVIQKSGIYALQVSNPTEGATYAWTNNGQALSETAATIRTIQAGSYTVISSIKHSATLTCTSKASAAYEFVLESGNARIGVFPNPSTDGNVTIEALENLSDVTIIVYDQTGRTLMTKTFASLVGQQKLDLSDLPYGTYHIKVRTSTFNESKKIVLSQP